MGQVLWVLAAAAAVGGMIGLTSLGDQKPEPVRLQATASAAEAVTAPVEVSASSGSALAVAAFGLSALQPDTYNGELVLEIIDASHLDEDEKQGLAAELAAAEAGRADLDDVLEDVRVALAVE